MIRDAGSDDEQRAAVFRLFVISSGEKRVQIPSVGNVLNVLSDLIQIIAILCPPGDSIFDRFGGTIEVAGV